MNLKLCVFELDLRVFELRFTGCQLLLEAVQCIVQSLDITENICSQRYRMPQLMLQGDFVLPAEAVKEQLHIKAAIFTDVDRVRICHGLAESNDGFTGCFLVRYRSSRHYHRREPVLIWQRILSKMSHVSLIALNPLLQRFDLLWELLDDLILQRITLTQVVGLEKLQAGNINVQIHLFLNVRITGAQGFDFSIGQSGFVNILRRTNRALGGHDLADELLLALHKLIEVAVEGVLCHVGVDIHFRILVALPDDTAFPLLQIGRTPGTIQMMECHQLGLNIRACAHFLCGTKEHSDLAGPNLAKQLLLLGLSFCRVDIGDLFSGDSFLNEFLSEIVIYIELAVVVRRGQIAEDHLCGSALRCALPNIEDIIGAG